MIKQRIKKLNINISKKILFIPIFLVSLINFWSAEEWLVFTVEWTWTSFSISNFCRPNNTTNSTSITYSKVKIKIWDEEINTQNCNNLISFRHDSSYINNDYINRNIAYYSTNWEVTCYIIQLNEIKLNSTNYWNFEIKCNTKFNDNGPHTITIEDPLYSTENYQSWQITNIKIWLTGSYSIYTIIDDGNGGHWEDVNYNYSSGNITAINQMRWLPKLRTLDLSNNKIQSTDFLNNESTNNLHEIDLSNNQISLIDSSARKCSLLEKLNLSSNKISTIKFKSLTNLKYLDLSLNKLSTFEKNTFSSLKNLTWLDLQWQKSDNLTIQQYAFSWLNNLESLYLQDNKISSLEWRTFHWLTNIKYINLGNCKIWTMNPDTNNLDFYPFDNFGTDNTWTINIVLSNNLLNTIPESLERIISWHKTFLNLGNWLRLNENNTGTSLNLNLKNNPINYVKIKKNTIIVGDNTFEWNWFSQSWYSNYKRNISDSSWNIIQSWNTNNSNRNIGINIPIAEYTSWTFNVYLLDNNWTTVANDSITVRTYSASTIDIYAQWSNNPLDSSNNTNFKKRNVELNFVWEPYGSQDVYYNYTITKDSKTYLTWTYTGNNYNKIFFFENWSYNLNIKMCETDSECKNTANWVKISKNVKFSVSVPYENNILNITYPENNSEIEDKLEYISRTHDRNYCNENSYLSEMNWFIYEITDKNWINHLSWTNKLNTDCSETWYNVSTTDLKLPNWKYTLTIKEIDKYWNSIKSENITFQKWKIFEVSFVTNWSSINKIEIGSWEKLSKPADPTRYWYIFKWWYTDSSYTTEYDFNTPVTNNLTLYAQRERDPTIPQKYILTIYYKYSWWWSATGTKVLYITGWDTYSVVSPIISDYTADYPVVEWTMPNSNTSFTVYYSYSWWGGWGWWWGGWGWGTVSSNTYTLTIYYKYSDWWNASSTHTESVKAWNSYSVSSPYISNYTPNYTVVEWTMPSYNKTIYVYYTKNKSNYLTVNASNRYPSTNEWINLNIGTDSNYTEKINFSKLQYRSSTSSSWSNIPRTSTTYVSDYSYDWSAGYYRMTRSDYGYATINNLIKFKRSGYYRIYITDAYGNEAYVDINVDETNENWSTESDLSLSTSNNNPDKHEPISITLKTDNYIGKLKLYAKYKDSSNSRVKISNTSTTYFSDYSNIWELWYYNMVSSDKWKKTLSDLVTFKKDWSYRIYAEDEKWYLNYIQINVDASDDNDTTTTSNQDNAKDYDIESVLQSLLSKDSNSDSKTGASPEAVIENLLGNTPSTTDTSEEIYIARSCKQYKLQYNSSLNAFTSPDMKKSEYFINKDYLKRYLDSKNPQKSNCPINSWWISTPFSDSTNSSNSFTAPNGKVYSISNENWSYSSSNFTTNKSFATLAEIKNFIKSRNPLIWI